VFSIPNKNFYQEKIDLRSDTVTLSTDEMRKAVEDIVLVTPSGGECLNNVTKDIIVIE